MKKRAASLLLALVLLVQMMGTAFAADLPLLISPKPATIAEYTMQEGDVVFIPGAVTAGTKCEAYVIHSATVEAGQKVIVEIPAGTSKADGTSFSAGKKGNISADRFWGVRSGTVVRLVGTWESTKSSNYYAYKVGYHDIIADLTDTDITLANNEKHNGSGNCAHNFNSACGEKSSSNRYAECAAVLTVDRPVILDLRHNVMTGAEKAVAELADVKALCDQGLAAVNAFTPNGTQAGGDLEVMIVVDFEHVSEPTDMDVPEGVQTKVGRSEQAINFNGGGTLELTQYGSLEIAGTVTGKTEVVFATMPTAEFTYVTAPSATPDDAFCFKGEQGKLVVTDDGTVKRWSMTGLPDVGLRITAPEGVKVQLHSGSMARSVTPSPGNVIPVTSRTTENGQTTHYYNLLPRGEYHYSLQQEGYYTVLQNIDYNEQRSKEGYTFAAATMHKMAGNGFELSGYTLHTPEVMDKVLQSSPDQWGEKYEKIFTSPYFTRDKSETGMHQQTTHQELMDYIRALDEKCDYMYIYDHGTSPKYGYEMPLVVFTKENIKGKSLEEVAELFRTNPKPTLHFQGQIHSREPAAGEVTLAFIGQMADEYGDKVLNTMDAYFIPRLNPDGAYEWIRQSAFTKQDMNRDFMAVNNEEVRLAIDAYNMFRPEATIVTHELFSLRNSSGREANIVDVEFSMSSTARTLPEATDVSMALLEQMRVNVVANGLRPGTYSDYAYSANLLVDNGYFGSRGSIGVLTETLGIWAGQSWMERRVVSSYIVLETLIDYVAANPDYVVDLVRRNRADLIAKGEKYEEDDLFVAHQTASRSGPVWPEILHDQFSGEVIDANGTVTLYVPTEADIKLARTRPTAYVIPKNLPKAADVLALMDKHDIKWYELPAGSEVKLQQYVMVQNPATLTADQLVHFKDGAYVFTMNQDTANILGMLMEPNSVGHSTSGLKCNIVDMEYAVKDANGYLPIYRYCHDLVDGKITVEAECKGGESCPAAKFGDVDTNAWYHKAVDNVLTNGIMSGYNATTFGTNDSLTRAMVVQVLYNRMGKPEVKAENKFSDVAEGAWYYDAVRWAANKGIVSGYGDGKFGPEDAITLEQAAVILHNYSGKPKAEGDLSTVGTYSDWAAEALRWCEANGLLKNIPFGQAVETATRAQTAQLLTNYLNP